MFKPLYVPIRSDGHVDGLYVDGLYYDKTLPEAALAALQSWESVRDR